MDLSNHCCRETKSINHSSHKEILDLESNTFRLDMITQAIDFCCGCSYNSDSGYGGDLGEGLVASPIEISFQNLGLNISQ